MHFLLPAHEVFMLYKIKKNKKSNLKLSTKLILYSKHNKMVELSSHLKRPIDFQ